MSCCHYRGGVKLYFWTDNVRYYKFAEFEKIREPYTS